MKVQARVVMQNYAVSYDIFPIQAIVFQVKNIVHLTPARTIRTVILMTGSQEITMVKEGQLESYVAKWMARRVRDIQEAKKCVPQELLGIMQIEFAKKWGKDSATGKMN